MSRIHGYCWLIAIVLVMVCLLPAACKNSKTEIEPAAPPPTMAEVKTITPAPSPTPSLTPTVTTMPAPSISASPSTTPTATTSTPAPTTSTPASSSSPTPAPTTTPAQTITPTATPTPTTTPTPAPTPAPALTGISPSSGLRGTSQTVTINGSNLAGASTSGVSFGTGITVNSVNINSEGSRITTSIAISAGAATGTRDVTVTTPGGAATLPKAFNVTVPSSSGGGGNGNSGVGDNIKPTVSSVSPLNNATDVLLKASVSVTFSEAMNTGTINTSSFTLKQGETAITGGINYNATNTAATFVPSADLLFNTKYTARLDTAITDASGNALASVYSWSFTTARQPEVDSVTPDGGATGVVMNTSVSAVFSKAMDTNTINNNSFTLMQGNTPVPGEVTCPSNTAATFTPNSDLTSGNVYTATLTTAIKDASGYALASEYSWSFTTGGETTMVVIEPSPSTVSQGATFTVGIKVANVTDLTSFNCQVNFDSSLLQLDDSVFTDTDGVEDGKVGDLDFPVTTNVVGDGKIRIVGFTGMDLKTTSGDGYLAKLHLKVKAQAAAGTTTIELFTIKLIDQHGLEILCTPGPGTITISP